MLRQDNSNLKYHQHMKLFLSKIFLKRTQTSDIFQVIFWNLSISMKKTWKLLSFDIKVKLIYKIMTSVFKLATARHQIQQMKERSKAELKQALEDLLEGEDGVSVSRGLIVL